jgi:hypothetical protein
MDSRQFGIRMLDYVAGIFDNINPIFLLPYLRNGLVILHKHFFEDQLFSEVFFLILT